MKMPAIYNMSLKEHPNDYDIVNYIKIESCGHSARSDLYVNIHIYIYNT